MEISSTFLFPNITGWGHLRDQTHSKYTDLSNVAHNILSITPDCGGVKASFSFGRDVIGWRQSETTCETLREQLVVRQFAQADKGILAGDFTVLDTTQTDNNLELKRDAEDI